MNPFKNIQILGEFIKKKLVKFFGRLFTRNDFLIGNFAKIHRFLFKISKGKILGILGGLPVLVLVTKGRKTNLPRENPLVYLRKDDRIIIIASKGGSDNHPQWYLNILKNSDVEILINGKRIKVNVHICTDKEKALLWPEIVEFYSGYQRYQSLTKRNIPVLQLTSEGIKTI